MMFPYQNRGANFASRHRSLKAGHCAEPRNSRLSFCTIVPARLSEVVQYPQQMAVLSIF